MPDIIWLARRNVKTQFDAYIDALHYIGDLDMPQNLHQIIFQLDMAF